MAFVLSLVPTSPFRGGCTTSASGRSSSAPGSSSSQQTVKQRHVSGISNDSFSSFTSFLSLPRHNPEGPNNPSLDTLNPAHLDASGPETVRPIQPEATDSISDEKTDLYRKDKRCAANERSSCSSISPINDFESDEQIGRQNDGDDEHCYSVKSRSFDPALTDAPRSKVFRRWVSTLRRRKARKLVAPLALNPREQRWTLDDFDVQPPQATHRAHRRSSSCGSSLNFVVAVRSVTATLAGTSLATISNHNTKLRKNLQRSSVVSSLAARASNDSQRSAMDEGARQRSRKRRKKLEELIRSEESYVADMKALANAYFTLLDNESNALGFARDTAQKCFSGILQLHDDLLGQLHHAVPFAKYDQSLARISETSNRSHVRWHSIDAIPTRKTLCTSHLASLRQSRRSLSISRISDEEQVALQCDPEIIARVSQIFQNLMNRFSIYEDFGAHYDLIQRDIAETQRSILDWEKYDRAIETISSAINPFKTREANRKKAMTVKDLLIKPIQRLPRYELLFNDMCKLTPVCDGPEFHAVIQKTTDEINRACRRMDYARENPMRARTIETTWLIGDRLSFSSQVPKSIYLQLLGEVILCGCLFITYRGKDCVRGSYVICILFESTLFLASAQDDQPKYSILAGIALAHAVLEETDDGKGLQCLTTPHSWKMVFEYLGRMFEIIFVACSAVEAACWKTKIEERIGRQSQDLAKGASNVLQLQSPLTNEMKSVGRAFGRPGSFVRRMSVHRAATVGPRSEVHQVIVKNTQACKEVLESSSSISLHIPRSQSVATPSHVQTLAPRRADRTRLEALLSDVWTKDHVPYPGMTRKSDPLRASANHVIRKLSMASFTSSFSSNKRSASYTSINQYRKGESHPPAKLTKSGTAAWEGRTQRRAPLVDFHNTPEAFLPVDFELHNAAGHRKTSALRSLTMTMERPFSRSMSNDEPQTGLGRAQSTRDARTTTPRIPQDSKASPSRSRTPDAASSNLENFKIRSPWKHRSRDKLKRLFG